MNHKIVAVQLIGNSLSPLQTVVAGLNQLYPERNLYSIEDWRNPPPTRAEQIRRKNIAIETFNSNGETDLLKAILGKYGSNLTIQRPFFMDIGANTILGSDVTIGSQVVILDIGPISIGSGTVIENSVLIGAVGHKLNPMDRIGFDYGYVTTIGSN